NEDVGVLAALLGKVSRALVSSAGPIGRPDGHQAGGAHRAPEGMAQGEARIAEAAREGRGGAGASNTRSRASPKRTGSALALPGDGRLLTREAALPTPASAW